MCCVLKYSVTGSYVGFFGTQRGYEAVGFSFDTPAFAYLKTFKISISKMLYEKLCNTTLKRLGWVCELYRVFQSTLIYSVIDLAYFACQDKLHDIARQTSIFKIKVYTLNKVL